MAKEITSEAVYETNFSNLKLLKRGKVRDVYDLGEHLLIVATDRLSAFDVVMPQPIPLKGKVLNQISNFWFERMVSLIPNHIVVLDVRDFPASCKPYEAQLRGRSVVVKKAQPFPVECIVRGYLAGSGLNEYKKTQSVCGILLPPGLVESSRLPEPIFTPSTKADVGHDENIGFEEVVGLVGKHYAERLKHLSLQIYRHACEFSESQGIIIADTKMEFGIFGDDLILIDELLTPDSSRFWLKATHKPGVAQNNYDKQYVRDYLLSVNFNKRPPGPQLPSSVIEKTSELYRVALKKLTGRDVD